MTNPKEKRKGDGGWGKKKQLSGNNAIKPGCTVQVKNVEPKRVGEVFAHP
jgi:hypothetical protein